MRITELLDKRSIRIDGAPKSKNEALDQMVELMAKSGKINDLEAYRQEVYRSGVFSSCVTFAVKSFRILLKRSSASLLLSSFWI